jgi:AcrR family transcriptional regulator
MPSAGEEGALHHTGREEGALHHTEREEGTHHRTHRVKGAHHHTPREKGTHHHTGREKGAPIITPSVAKGSFLTPDATRGQPTGRIAEVVGLVPSALYRYFPGKADILAAACLQAAALLTQAVEQNLRDVTDPHEALAALTATYVAYSFEHTALTSVANAELVGLPADLQRPLIMAQREHIAVWEQQLRSARPELDSRQARTLVHAGFGVVVEAGRRLRWQDSPAHRDAVAALLMCALGG